MPNKIIYNAHPREILQKEFLDPLSLSQNALAEALGVPANRSNAIVRGQRSITADTGLRLGRFFGLSEGYWLRLQIDFDMMEVKRQAGRSISAITPYQMPKTQTAIDSR